MKKIRLGALVSKKSQYGKMSLMRMLTDFYHTLQSPSKYFDGSLRTYSPDDDSDSEIEPPSETKMRLNLKDYLAVTLKDAAVAIDDMGTVDYANTKTSADVKVGNEVILADAPIPLLIWLESNLKELLTILKTIPTLDSSKHWSRDETTGNWVSGPYETKRTRKVTKAVVLYEATPEHPAQVREVSNDQRVGVWVDNFSSSRMTEVEKRKLVNRAEQLLSAVTEAKEEANSYTTEMYFPGTAIVEYLLKEL